MLWFSMDYSFTLFSKGEELVTLQAFTWGKSLYPGRISLGKFTSGFIFPRLKGHTGDHWTLGGLTSRLGAKMENMLGNQTD